MRDSIFIFAETAFHHEGDLDYLLALIDAAALAGASAIKFQVLSKADNLISIKHSNYKVLSKYIFSKKEWELAFKHAIKKKQELVIMPLDVGALSIINPFIKYIKFLEIHSVSFNDEDLIQAMINTKLPIMMGVGGRTLKEIVDFKKLLQKQLKVLMVGFQAFPSKVEDVKLGKISYLKSKFPKINIGYADHSAFDDPMRIKASEYAYLLGATIFEKHITLQEGVKRVDFESAIDSKTFKKYINSIRRIGKTIDSTSSFTDFTNSELNYRNRQKVIVAKNNISIGKRIGRSDLEKKMIDKPNGIFELTNVIGKSVIRNIEKGDIITFDSLK